MQKFYRWGFYLFGLCALGWLAGYVINQGAISALSIAMAMVILIVTEVVEYRRSNKKVHLIVPGIALIGAASFFYMLSN